MKYMTFFFVIIMALATVYSATSLTYDFTNGTVGELLTVPAPDIHTFLLSNDSSIRVTVSGSPNTTATITINRIETTGFSTRPFTLWNMTSFSSNPLYSSIINIEPNPSVTMELVWDMDSAENNDVLLNTVSWHARIGSAWVPMGVDGVAPYSPGVISYIVAGYEPRVTNLNVGTNLTCPPAQPVVNLTCSPLPAVNVSCPSIPNINLSCPQVNITQTECPVISCPKLECPSPGSLTENDRELVSSLVAQKIISQGGLDTDTDEIKQLVSGIGSKVDGLSLSVQDNKENSSIQVGSVIQKDKYEYMPLLTGFLLAFILLVVGYKFFLKKKVVKDNLDYLEEV